MIEKLEDRQIFDSQGTVYALRQPSIGELVEKCNEVIEMQNMHTIMIFGKCMELSRDKDGFLTHDVSDLYDKLPFVVHDVNNDTYEYADDDNFIEWSNDLDTKPRYDKIYYIKH